MWTKHGVGHDAPDNGGCCWTEDHNDDMMIDIDMHEMLDAEDAESAVELSRSHEA